MSCEATTDPEADLGTRIASDFSTSSGQQGRGTGEDESVAGSGSKCRGIVGLVVATAVATAIAFPLTRASRFPVFHEESNDRMCRSEECASTAARILEAMNRTADPCEDFYEFACGGWIARNPIPRSRSSWERFGVLQEELFQRLRALLEEERGKGESDSRPVDLAKGLYSVCMDTQATEALGLEPIHAVLNRLGLPREPPLDREIPSLDLARLAGTAQRFLGLDLFLDIYVSEDLWNTSGNVLMIEQVEPGIGSRYLLDTALFQTEVAEYEKYVREMAEVSSAGRNGSEFARDVVEFSGKIARIMTSPEERRSEKHRVRSTTIDELLQPADLSESGRIRSLRWNWTTYLDAVFENTSVAIQPTLDRLIQMDPRYFSALPGLLAESPAATLSRFVWWRVYSAIAPLTLQRFRDMKFRLDQRVFGLKEETPRWKICTAVANANFGMALTREYARSYFDDRLRRKALLMLMDAKLAFDRTLAELDWMDEETRARARSKLRAIRPFIGAPLWINDSTKLNQLYEGMDVLPGRLVDTHLLLTNVSMKRSLEKLREKPDRDRWISSGTAVNAHYSIPLNSVVFPAGILRPPFYGNGLDSVDYGAMGSSMGHELVHGFDDQGRGFDEEGNLRQWWTDRTLRRYREKVGCMIEQYGSYSLPELGSNFTVNGMTTQGENIADNGGIRQAYRAYQLFQARNVDRATRLPGLEEYSEHQLFFLAFAQVWCGNYTSAALKSTLTKEAHAPNRFRVIGTLSNNADFARAWNCPTESPMNPAHKCVLW